MKSRPSRDILEAASQRGFMMKAKALGFVVGIAVAAGAIGPADAQFFPNYPVIIVPPPAQNLVVPRPKPTPKPAQPAPAAPPPDASAQSQCHFQGQTRVCQ